MCPALARLGLAAALLTSPGIARADHGEGSFRLGAGSTLFSIEHLPEPDTDVLLYGLPLIPYQTGIQAGTMLTDALYLGAGVALGGATIDLGFFGNNDIIVFTILPRVAYVLPLTELVSVFFGAEVGLTIFGDPDNDPEDIFKMGGVGGIHVFAERSFSVDVEATLAFVHHPDSANAGFQFGLNMLLSGWLGGASEGAPEPEPAAEPEPERAAEPEPAPVDPEPAPVDPEAGLY